MIGHLVQDLGFRIQIAGRRSELRGTCILEPSLSVSVHYAILFWNVMGCAGRPRYLVPLHLC